MSIGGGTATAVAAGLGSIVGYLNLKKRTDDYNDAATLSQIARARAVAEWNEKPDGTEARAHRSELLLEMAKTCGDLKNGSVNMQELRDFVERAEKAAETAEEEAKKAKEAKDGGGSGETDGLDDDGGTDTDGGEASGGTGGTDDSSGGEEDDSAGALRTGPPRGLALSAR